MDTRQIFQALFDSRGPAGHPGGEWIFVGDLGCFEPERLSRIVSTVITGPRAYVAVSRREASEVSVETVPEVVLKYLEFGNVRIADIPLKQFVEVTQVGVARAWSHERLPMPSTLVFPEGIRLAHRHEIRGPKAHRAAAYARIRAAKIEPGFTLTESKDPRFAFYAEANVDAPRIWAVFRDLCQSLLGAEATFVINQIDYEPMPIGTAGTLEILGILESYRYQLTHDGMIQFGLVHQVDGLVREVFVAPTKHFMVWLDNPNSLHSVMKKHSVPQADKLQFIDQYPRISIPLPRDQTPFRDHGEFIRQLAKQFAES